MWVRAAAQGALQGDEDEHQSREIQRAQAPREHRRRLPKDSPCGGRTNGSPGDAELLSLEWYGLDARLELKACPFLRSLIGRPTALSIALERSEGSRKMIGVFVTFRYGPNFDEQVVWKVSSTPLS